MERGKAADKTRILLARIKSRCDKDRKAAESAENLSDALKACRLILEHELLDPPPASQKIGEILASGSRFVDTLRAGAGDPNVRGVVSDLASLVGNVAAAAGKAKRS